MSTRWLTPEQVAQDPRLPRFNADWVRKQLRAGKLRGSLTGNRWLVPEDAIDELLEAHTNQPRGKKRRAVRDT